mgnify:CR=1 FL=1
MSHDPLPAEAGAPSHWICYVTVDDVDAAAVQREAIIQSALLSARSLHRILRVARTIADLDGAATIAAAHLAEAIGYRLLNTRARGFIQEVAEVDGRFYGVRSRVASGGARSCS